MKFVYVCVRVCALAFSYPLLAAAEHQEGLDVVLLQVSVPLPSESRLHLVVLIQVLQRGFGDVYTPTNTSCVRI